MGLVFKTKLFSSKYIPEDSQILKGSKNAGLIGGGLVGSGVGYLGGRLVGKILTPSEEDFISEYLLKNPESNSYDAYKAYKNRRSIYSKTGTMIGALVGGIKGYNLGSKTGDKIVKTKRYLEKTIL